MDLIHLQQLRALCHAVRSVPPTMYPWFFLPAGGDQLPDGTVVPTTATPFSGENPIDLLTYWQTCNQSSVDPSVDYFCNYSMALHEGDLPSDPWPAVFDHNLTTMAPWYVMKAAHPKTIGYNAIAQSLYNLLTTFA